MFGQLCVFAVPVEPDEDGGAALADGLAVAACATTAPPPTSAPDIVRATSALLMRFLMIAHLLSVDVVEGQ
jgi:hypothetical protein